MTLTKKRWFRIVVGIVGAIVVLLGAWLVYINVTYRRDFSSTPLPDVKASTDPKVIEHGRYVTQAIAHCSSCHGNGEFTNRHELAPEPNDMRGGYIMPAGPFGTFYPKNLTPDPDTGLGKYSDAQIARAILHGVDKDGHLAPLMMFAVGPMANEDLVAVVSYLRSIPAIKNETKPDEWGLVAKALAGRFNPRMDTAPKYEPPADTPNKARGEYLANGPALCFGCHTPADPLKGFAEVGPRFSGAAEPDPDEVDPSMENMPPNLTSDPETGAVASYDEQAWIDRFKKVGQTAKGSHMPWPNFKQMTNADLKSILLYLKTVPPVKRQTGPTHRKAGWKPGQN